MSSAPNKPTPTPPKAVARLKTIKPNTPSDANTAGTQPNVQTGIPKAKKEFKPNVPTSRKKKEDNKDPLAGGAISDLINSSLSPLNVGPSKQNANSSGKFRPNLNPNRKKPAATPITNMFTTPLVQAESLQHSTYETNKKNEKKDSDLLAQLFHEMEVDPMQPFHPTHLPLVDPRKIMKAYSLDDASKDINEKKRELELKIANGELSDTTNFNLQGGNSTDNDNGREVEVLANATKKKKEISTKDKPFYIEDQFLNKDNLFFFQLPNSLPTSRSRPIFNFTNPVLPPKPIQSTNPDGSISLTITTPDPNNLNSSIITTTTLNKDNTTTIITKSTSDGKSTTITRPTEEGDGKPKPVELDSKTFIPMIYPNDFPSSLKEIESGKLGTLKIYKSGKTILEIGKVKYDISSGDKLKFLEEVKCFQTKGGQEGTPTCYTLGIPSQHLVAAPIISQITN